MTKTTERILAAIERVAASGKEPSILNVRARLVRDSRDDRGASPETVAPILRAWKAEALERATGRIEAAVVALLDLRTRGERDEVRRRVQARTGGGIRLQIIARGRPRKPGTTSPAGHGQNVAVGSNLDRPPTGSRR